MTTPTPRLGDVLTKDILACDDLLDRYVATVREREVTESRAQLLTAYGAYTLAVLHRTGMSLAQISEQLRDRGVDLTKSGVARLTGQAGRAGMVNGNGKAMKE